MFAAIDAFEYPELHDESIAARNFFRHLAKLMSACGVKDFGIKVGQHSTASATCCFAVYTFALQRCVRYCFVPLTSRNHSKHTPGLAGSALVGEAQTPECVY